MGHFYRFNRGQHITGIDKDGLVVESARTYNDTVFRVSIETGHTLTLEEIKKDFYTIENPNCNIPVTTRAVEMIAETLVYEVPQWPCKDRMPHIDELENAFFAQHEYNRRSFREEDKEYLAKTDTSEFGFRQPFWLCNLFAVLRNDIVEYYAKQKIEIPKDVEWDAMLYALWHLALKSLTEAEWKKITVNKVPIAKCFYCGENVYASSMGFLDYAGDVSMSFGYGSRRDTSYYKALIHDHCSIKWQKDWKGVLPCFQDDYDYTKTGKLKLSPVKFEKEYNQYLKKGDHS